MDEEGIVKVSGTVDPQLLLKRLGKSGKRAELCWFQFGQCSSNLYPPPRVSLSSSSTNESTGNASVGHGRRQDYTGGPVIYYGEYDCEGYGGPANYYGDYQYNGYGGQGYYGDHRRYRPFAALAQSVWGRNAAADVTMI